jgi:hypothetical protein
MIMGEEAIKFAVERTSWLVCSEKKAIKFAVERTSWLVCSEKKAIKFAVERQKFRKKKQEKEATLNLFVDDDDRSIDSCRVV